MVVVIALTVIVEEVVVLAIGLVILEVLSSKGLVLSGDGGRVAVGEGSGQPMSDSEGDWLRYFYTGQQGELGATAERQVEAEDHAGGHEQLGS